jgi:hypothetical protein
MTFAIVLRLSAGGRSRLFRPEFSGRLSRTFRAMLKRPLPRGVPFEQSVSLSDSGIEPTLQKETIP